MYWWYLSFLILGLVSRGFRGRGWWLKLREVGSEEAQVGLRGWAVCKETHCPQFSFTVISNFKSSMYNISEKMSSPFTLSDGICPMSRLNSYIKCTNASQISKWQHIRFWHAAMLLVCECVDLQGKHWAPPEVKIDSNECRAAYSRAFDKTDEWPCC